MGISQRNSSPGSVSLVDVMHIGASCEDLGQGCDACALERLPYEDQLSAKEAFLARVYGEDVRLMPSGEPLGYRNRMDFVAAPGRRELRDPGGFSRADGAQECLLLEPRARDTYALARAALMQAGGDGSPAGSGFLRSLVVRSSSVSGERMLVVTTRTPGSREEHARFLSLLERLLRDASLTSLHWRVNDSETDVSVGEPYAHLGRAWIVDEIAGRQFRVYPDTFFQANAAMAGMLLTRAAAFAHGRVLDLYCGVGTISIIVSSQEGVTGVVGVEIVPESVEAAKENAILNGVSRQKCTFVCEDAANFLRSYDERFDTVMCDPAREGLAGSRALLLEHLPQRIVYVSSNPRTHKEDIDALGSRYRVALLEGYDLFPQTGHVGVLGVLERKGQ